MSILSASGPRAAGGGEEFVPPGPNSFDFSGVPLFHIGDLAVTKPMVQLVLGGLLVLAAFGAGAYSLDGKRRS